MMRIYISILFLLAAMATSAQTEQRSVLESDMSGKYKQAVHDGFYHELGNYSGLERGYHGFVDAGYTFGIGDYHFGRFEINSSHGYQFNPYIYVGAGVGFHFMSSYETPHMTIPLDVREFTVDVPLFANLRWTIINKWITPFVDGKIGYYLTHHGGLYSNLSAGCRFSLFASQAISVSIGYTNEKLEFRTFDRFFNYGDLSYLRSARKLWTEGLSVKIGYEF